MTNGNGNVNDALNAVAKTAAESQVLTLAARVFTIVTPMIFVPFLLWLFSTVSANQLTLIEVKERSDTNDRRITVVEEFLRNQDKEFTLAREQRRQEALSMTTRMATVEAQNKLILEQITRILNRLDAPQPPH